MGTAADLSHASFDCCICVGRAIADPANVRCLIARLVAVLPSNIMQPQNYYHWAWHRRGKAVRCHRLNGSSSRLQSKPNCMLSYVWHIWRVVLCCCSFFFISERTLWHRHSEQWIRAHHRLHVLVHPSLLHTHTLCVCNARIYHTNNWLVCVCTWTGAAALTMLCPFHLFLSLYSASCSPRALPLVWSAGVCVHFVTPLCLLFWRLLLFASFFFIPYCVVFLFLPRFHQTNYEPRRMVVSASGASFYASK